MTNIYYGSLQIVLHVCIFITKGQHSLLGFNGGKIAKMDVPVVPRKYLGMRSFLWHAYGIIWGFTKLI